MYPLLLLISFLLIFILILFLFTAGKSNSSQALPPGNFFLPLVGETLDFMRANRNGNPEGFISKRATKHSTRVFRTSLLGEEMAVLCGAAGNKFLFGNENKTVRIWWPSPIRKLLGRCVITMLGDEGKKMRRVLLSYLGPEALARYVTTMDKVAIKHLKSHWEGKKEVKVHPSLQFYAFQLSCRLLISVEEEDLVSRLAAQFKVFVSGLIDIPINIPGTRFYSAMRAASSIRKELQRLLRERRVALHQKLASPSQDLLSHLLVTADEDGSFLTETEIVNNILCVIFASYDTSSTATTMVIRYLAQMPQVYQKVLQEQLSIARGKEAGELLQLEDIQKMKYSWNVVCEVLRVMPPVAGGFREALVDIDYDGYRIPKGWKIFWSSSFTHKDPTLFPRPEAFDESRFEGAGPAPFSFIPFGGGPRMCLGKEFARIQILTFLHNAIRMFKWDLLIPDEKITYDPMSVPVEGLPVRLQPQKLAV